MLTRLRVARPVAPIGARSASTWWSHVESAPPDPILGITEAFKKDTDTRKINLGVGAYRDDSGKPYVLDVVRKAESVVASRDKEYAAITGVNNFRKLAAKLAFGHSRVIEEGLNVTAQSISGTGALRLGGEVLNRMWTGSKDIYLPTPSWGNHRPIFKDSGLNVKQYRYYDATSVGLDFVGMMEDISAMPKGSIVLLHACAHNPTGIDLNEEQWREASSVMKNCGHFAFFDSAYQGFASGDLDQDAQSIRIFTDDGHDVFLAQSFAKNMGLYGERCGAFTAVLKNREEAAAFESQLKQLIRPMYSSPPIHGANIAEVILSDSELRKEWEMELSGMSQRIKDMRAALFVALQQSDRNWSHVTEQIGMFCYTGLTPEQVDALAKEHVYLTRDGRISMAGVTSGNVKYLAESILKVTANA